MMDDDTRPLGYYGVQNGMQIHVIDSDPYSLSRNGGLEDVSQVKKYEMTDEEYDKRTNTLRAWKKEQLKQNPQFKFQVQTTTPAAESVDFTDASMIEGICVGNRCEVAPGSRRGEVRYVGEVNGLAAGYWVRMYDSLPACLWWVRLE